MMNPRRFTIVAPAFCGSLVLAGVIVGWLAGFGSAGTENTGAVPIENGAASLAANAGSQMNRRQSQWPTPLPLTPLPRQLR